MSLKWDYENEELTVRTLNVLFENIYEAKEWKCFQVLIIQFYWKKLYRYSPNLQFNKFLK